MRFDTWIISGKYLIVERNFSCKSHKKNAVVLDANFPTLAVAIFDENTAKPEGGGGGAITSEND